MRRTTDSVLDGPLFKAGFWFCCLLLQSHGACLLLGQAKKVSILERTYSQKFAPSTICANATARAVARNFSQGGACRGSIFCYLYDVKYCT